MYYYHKTPSGDWRKDQEESLKSMDKGLIYLRSWLESLKQEHKNASKAGKVQESHLGEHQN